MAIKLPERTESKPAPVMATVIQSNYPPENTAVLTEPQYVDDADSMSASEKSGSNVDAGIDGNKL
jgi:hypothetical protein